MDYLIDLHTHSTCSDGELSPQEIYKHIKEISKNKKVIWSITDHDSVDAYDILEKSNIHDKNVLIISGCELSFNYQGTSRDMLAYSIDTKEMKQFLDNLYTKEFKIKKQQTVLDEFVKKCKQHGLVFDDNITIENGRKSEAYGKVMKELRRNSINLEKIPDIETGFYRKCFSNVRSDFYVSEVDGIPTLKEVVDLIHSMGGLAFVAHPFDYGDDINKTTEYIKNCVSAGIDGIEIMHYSISNERILILRDLKNKFNLLESGGSDFHGENVKKNVKIFTAKDNINVDYNNLSWAKMREL